MCQHAQTVYVDNGPLERVGSRELVGSGRFWVDDNASRIWIGDDPTGRTVEVSHAPAAIAGSAKNVVVQGFVVEKFANPAQHGAVHADGGGWTIERNEVRANHGTSIYATGAQVLYNHIHHNGQLGLGGTGGSQLVEGNQIDNNNTAGFSPLWEAGGTKFVRTDGLVIRGNSAGTALRPRLTSRSTGILSLEIRMPSCSCNRSATTGRRSAGAHLLNNIDVHSNQVTMASHGLIGQVDDTGSDASYGRNVRFRGNTYRLPSSDATVFAWRGMAWDPITWRQRFGQDVSSTSTNDRPNGHEPARVNRSVKMRARLGPCLHPVGRV
jgi:hypothetical protein